ncbi:MAG: ATP-binding cassette domain-containing protein [Deferrisomatales bacterium]|nr:ATP-binding cassette domain-containing protein [Deferrisomatales bacterium]
MTEPKRPVAIELAGVEKRFGDQPVLRGVDLTVHAGTTTVLVGPSGGGKSVVLKHMLGLMKPDRGRVTVLGRDLATARRKELKEVRAHFGVLFQGVALFDSMTIYENVALPLRQRTKSSEAEIREAVEEKLGWVDLENVNHKYPAQVSGGMQKRVGLARALILNPSIVFFDEPTSGLDVRHSNEIYRLFQRTQARLQYTAIIVSHNVPKVFKLADTVALLAEGQIQACLSPEAFQLSRNPFIRSFVETTMGPIYASEVEETEFHEQV